MKSEAEDLPVIGWREWVKLPDLNVGAIKAKVDTGARSSSIHTSSIETFRSGGTEMVRFSILPHQKSEKKETVAEAEILELRKVRSSNGEVAVRPVIVTRLSLMGRVWPVELTLANRDEMGFRMLLGREAFRGRFLVDASRSFAGGRLRRKNKRRSDNS
ncbi:MAG: RimK/LysX family protein [Planctomycetota bacterium]|nr:RimK/LysX family protein [Planctomycetota bacterium]